MHKPLSTQEENRRLRSPGRWEKTRVSMAVEYNSKICRKGGTWVRAWPKLCRRPSPKFKACLEMLVVLSSVWGQWLWCWGWGMCVEEAGANTILHWKPGCILPGLEWVFLELSRAEEVRPHWGKQNVQFKSLVVMCAVGPMIRGHCCHKSCHILFPLDHPI